MLDLSARRAAKKFIYTVFYLAILLGIVSGLYFWLKPVPTCGDKIQNQGEEGVDCGGPCATACEVFTLKPVAVVMQPKLFFLDEPAVLFQISNPNPSYGARNLPYVLELYGQSGELLKTHNSTTFIYPGKLQKNVFVFLGPSSLAKSVKVTLHEPAWLSVSDFSRPDIDFMNQDQKVSGNQYIVSGTVVNKETLLFPRVAVEALFYDKNGSIVSLSRTEVNDVRAFEQRYFQLEHPYLTNIDFGKTRVFIEALRP